MLVAMETHRRFLIEAAASAQVEGQLEVSHK